MKNKTSHTHEQSTAYQAMFNYFNERLFDGKLPQVILNFSRKGKTFGFFAPNRWQKGGAEAHEISLNPEHLISREPIHWAGTLVHEMTHLQQQETGKPSRSGYHNSAWAGLMEDVGLIPSTTGQPGGKRTGQKCSHYIQQGGKFEQAFKEMPEEYLLPWLCVAEEKKDKKASSRVKYACEGCGAQVWGKKELNIMCGDCDLELAAELPEGEEPATPAAALKLAADER